MTPYMTRYCDDGNVASDNFSTCGWQLPGGAKLNTSLDVFSMTSYLPNLNGDMPYTDVLKLVFMGTEAQSGPPLNYNPWARQCTLQYCTQTFNASVTNGTLTESVSSTGLNTTVLSTANSTTDTPAVIKAPDGTSYIVTEAAMLGTQSWFSSLFADGRATRANMSAHLDDTSVIVNLTVGISSGTTYFDNDVVQTFYWDYYEYASGLDKAMSDLATSMTVAFRSFGGDEMINGTEWSMETYVHVRWAWISLPLVVLALTIVFLVVVIWENHRCGTDLWKSSAIALLFHGLDTDTEKHFTADSLNDIKKEAKDVKVQLEVDDDGRMLLRM